MGRSTRNKIRWQAQKAVESIDQAMAHLQALDAMGEGDVPAITKNLPNVVACVEIAQDVVRTFRLEL